MSTLGPTTTTPILAQQRKSTGCFTYPYTVWITRAAEDVGVVLADLGRRETDPGNLMNERTNSGNTRLHYWRCERLRMVTTAFRLAEPVR